MKSKVTSVVDFIATKFGSLHRRVSKVFLHSTLNAYRDSSGDSRFIASSFLVCYKW